MSNDYQGKDRWGDSPVGAQQATIYPFARWQGKEHEYALTVDVSELTDVTKPQAKMNIVVDNKIVRTMTIQDMILYYHYQG